MDGQHSSLSASATGDNTSPSRPEQCDSAPAPLRNPLGSPPLWTRDEVWRSHVAALAAFPAAVSVLELCAGTGAASIALQLLLGWGKVRLAGAWDLDEDLRTVYDIVHGPSAPGVHLGQPGDILTTDLAAFPDAHVVVAGPPCPPFSACGKRLNLEDHRARPFERCVDILAELSRRRTPGQPERSQGGRGQLMFSCWIMCIGIAS